jgi:hypothetical protein
MHDLRKVWHPLILALLLVLGASIRFAVAPYSAGPDVAQFWSFAEAFRLYGLDFYRYASAKIDLFPFQFWAYVYPPVWLLILGTVLLFVPNSSANQDMVTIGWRLAEKTPIILADLAIGLLLYWAVLGSKYRKLLFAALWLFSPAVWYNSAVFGQFDSIAAAFLLSSVIFLERSNDRLAFILAALAGMTKQHTLIPVAMMAVIYARQLSWRRLSTDLALMLGVALILSVPFLITGNFRAYFQAVLLPGQAADYQYPLMFAFNGGAATLTYLHNVKYWDTLGLIKLGLPLLGLGLLSALILAYVKRISLLRGALIGILVFIVFFYRINYQYLVVSIALALFVASRTPYLGERMLALALAVFPSLWLWLINVATWFVYLEPRGDAVVPILDKIGLTHQGFSDLVYLCFTLGLSLLCAAYLVLAFTRWKAPLKPLIPDRSSSLSFRPTPNLPAGRPSK